ncbi:MAG TPA: lipid II flippase MurJ, partial [Dehalococcoidia bacterium]|nr:lipid II flippase MurJ [Dehalococcoidia bacterium]
MIPDISPRKHLRETTLLAYLRATGVLLGLGALLKVVGALQQAALAALYGAGPQLDAYFVAVALPNLLITFLIYGPLGLAFVPSFVSHLQTEDRPSIPSLVPSVLTGTAALGVVFVVVGYLGAPQIVGGLAPGFGPDTSSMAVQL